MLSANPSPSHMAMAAATSRLVVPGGQATGKVFCTHSTSAVVTVEIVMQRFDRRMNLLSCNSLLPHCTNTWTPWTPWRLGLPRSRLRLTAVEWWKDELFLRRLCSVRTGVDVLRILARADRRICYWRTISYDGSSSHSTFEARTMFASCGDRMDRSMDMNALARARHVSLQPASY